MQVNSYWTTGCATAYFFICLGAGHGRYLDLVPGFRMSRFDRHYHGPYYSRFFEFCVHHTMPGLREYSRVEPTALANRRVARHRVYGRGLQTEHGSGNANV